MNCRICGSRAVTVVAPLPCYLDFVAEVFDCGNCGCRWVAHDAQVYERLHQSPGSYAWHQQVQQQVSGYFAAGDHAAVLRQLRTDPRMDFVLTATAQLPPGSRVLEIGCSRGYLTAGLLAQGHQAVGVDVSVTALADARTAFGEHFLLAGDPAVDQGLPWDAIVHVGTIGCVADPLGLTRHWLTLLRPGGVLVFNAPDRAPCDQLGTPWVSGTLPPDLVTLFPAGFWAAHFAAAAEVTVTTRHADPVSAWFGRLLAPRVLPWRAGLYAPRPLLDRWFAWRRRGWRLLARLLALVRKPAPVAADFGVYVSMRRR